MTVPSPVPERPLLSLDDLDPQTWAAMVERASERMADRMWGAPCWYRGAAGDALAAALGLDPKDTQRMLHVALDGDDDDAE